jgi:hypothetical protein
MPTIAKFGVSQEHEREEILEAFQRMEWLSRAVQSVLPPKKYTGRDHAI